MIEEQSPASRIESQIDSIGNLLIFFLNFVVWKIDRFRTFCLLNTYGSLSY